MAAGEPALALGNAVGSNIANFGLTLGAAALCAPLRLRWPALPPLLLCLVLAAVAALLLAQDGRRSRIDGPVLVAASAVALGVDGRVGRRQARRRDEVG